MKRSRWTGTLLLVAVCVTNSYGETGYSENMALVGRWARGECGDGDVVGNIAFLGDGAYLKTYDFTNPASPNLLGRYLAPGPIQGIDVQGGHAYLADWEDGLRIIDVSNPAAPFEIGFLDTPDHALGICVVGSLAYVADGYYGGLRIIDVTNAAAPSEIGSYITPGTATDVVVNGGYAYVADGSGGLRIIDVTVPATPSEIGVCPTDNATLDVVVSGLYAYIADYYDGFRVIDVSVPTMPAVVGSLYTGYTVTVEMGGGHVYTSGQVFLNVVDVDDPTDPRTVGSCNPYGTQQGKIVYDAGVAYVAGIGAGFRAIDVTVPTAPAEVGHVEGVQRTYGVDARGEFAYVANYGGGLRVVDISDPGTPAEVGFYRSGVAVKDVRAIGDHAYLACAAAGVRIVDISTPATPTEVGAEDLPMSADAITVSGNYAFVTGQSTTSDDLFVLDVSNPAGPVRTDSLDLPGTVPRDVAVEGDHVYVAAGSEGLRIIDVANPGAIVEVGAETSIVALGVAIQGDYAYVAAAGSGMKIIDVSNPAAPVVVGSRGPGAAWGIAVRGAYAFVANQYAGVRVFDVSDVTSPIEVGRYDTADEARSLVVLDDLIITTDWRDGIWILEMDPPTAIDHETRARDVSLRACVPNPFNQATTIRYDLAAPSSVTLRIYDVAGREVRVLRDGALEGVGPHAVTWNGANDRGTRVASGVYYYRLETGTLAETRSMVLVKGDGL